MKTYFIKLLFFAIILLGTKSKAQITLDTILPNANLTYFFKIVQISDSETKYYVADTTANIFNLYNMDFTPFMINIPVPEPFMKHVNPLPSIYQPIYITRALFDCDTSTIEYAYEDDSHSYESFYIMRTDGTQLFKLDSANGPFCYGCFGASDFLRPIRYTSSGFKLFLQRYWGGVEIYSLCGSLPTEISEIDNNIGNYITVYPNPSSQKIKFEIRPPNNIEEFELILVDNQSQVIKREKIISSERVITIDAVDLKSGMYFYSLCTKNKSYQNGKIIINK